MNILQIEIFNGTPSFVINTKYEIDETIIDIVLEHIKKIDLNAKLLIQIYFVIDNNGINLNKDNPGQMTVCNLENNSVYSYEIGDITEIENVLKKYMEKLEQGVPRIFDFQMFPDINEDSSLIFSDVAFQRICEVTQQFLYYKDLSLESMLTLKVVTSNGEEELFENGKSKKIENTILNIKEWKGLQEKKINAKGHLYIEDLNNYISSICMETGEYALSFKAFDEKNNKYLIIHLKCTVKWFWENISEILYMKKKYICLKKYRGDVVE